jgi:hypothetical protein
MARAESVLGVAARRRAGDTTNEDERDGGVGAWRHHGEEAVDETSTAGYDWTGWCSAGAEKQETARPAVLTTLCLNLISWAVIPTTLVDEGDSPHVPCTRMSQVCLKILEVLSFKTLLHLLV